MVDLQHLQLLAQLVDSIEVSIDKLEQAYQNNDSEDFQKSKQSIASFQQQIAEVLSK
jgi:hypothetical protein|tara:strand:+ start:216 stop:386 length:171 start_codon:yes stop_codon:yes gene_type:complete